MKMTSKREKLLIPLLELHLYYISEIDRSCMTIANRNLKYTVNVGYITFTHLYTKLQLYDWEKAGNL